MKKAFLAVLIVLLTLPLAFAAGGIDITPISTSLSGNSGTVSGSFNLTNTIDSSLTVSFSNYMLTSGSNTLTVSSISSRTIANGTTQTVSFSVPIGTSSPGTYTGALNVTNSTNNYLFGTVTINVNVGVNQNFSLPSTVSVNVDPGSSSTGILAIVNNGNVDLTGLSITYDSANFIDSYGNTISINFSQISGIDIAKGQTKNIVITAQAPINAREGTYTGTVTVNGPESKTFALSVTVKSILRITEITVKSSAQEDDEVTRGSNLSVTVEYENFANNIDITDIELTLKIMKSSTVLKDDDGEKIQEEVSVKDLDAGDDGSYTFKLKMPMDIYNGDVYTILAEISGENNDDSSQKFYYNMTETVEAVIEKHDIEIYKAAFDTASLACNDKSVILTVGVRNIGQSDEDIQLFARNSNLNLEQQALFTLDNDFSDEDEYSFEKSFIFNFNERPNSGTYLFYVDAYYDDGDEKKTKTVTLTVDSCSAQTTTTTTQTQTTIPQETQIVYVPTTAQTTVSTAPMSLTDTSRWKIIDWEIIGLIALCAVLAGAAIGFVIKLAAPTTQIKEYK